MSEENKKEPYLMPVEKVQERFAKQPIIETNWSKSKDGKFVIVKTTITDIKPIAFCEKVLENEGGK